MCVIPLGLVPSTEAREAGLILEQAEKVSLRRHMSMEDTFRAYTVKPSTHIYGYYKTAQPHNSEPRTESLRRTDTAWRSS
jgi:hypothetical protein